MILYVPFVVVHRNHLASYQLGALEYLLGIILRLNIYQLRVIVLPVPRVCLVFGQRCVGIIDIHAMGNARVTCFNGRHPAIEEGLHGWLVRSAIREDTIVELNLECGITMRVCSFANWNGGDSRFCATVQIDE